MTKQVKPKRKLSNIDFSGEGCHIALVSKQQGGPASGQDYALVMKAHSFSDEFVQKAQQVRVTMELPDFLERFFHLYSQDAQVLARMMGYVPEEENDEDESYEDWYENQIQSKLQSFEIMKAAHTGVLAEVLSKLSEDEYLSLLQDQEMVEKAMAAAEQKESADKADTSIASEVNKEEVSASNLNQNKLEKSMTKKQDEVTVEMVEKSALVTLQKAFDDQAVVLQKAQETIAKFEAEKKEAIEKARFEKLKGAVKDEAKATVLFKSLKLVESEEDFDASIKVLADTQSVIEKSALFQEQGAAVDQAEESKESAVAREIKKSQKVAK